MAPVSQPGNLSRNSSSEANFTSLDPVTSLRANEMERTERPPSSAARELQSVIKTYITLEMKALLILSLALVGSGCTTSSKYVNDPRAAAVGPAYLDYIDEYPRDRDTQF